MRLHVLIFGREPQRGLAVSDSGYNAAEVVEGVRVHSNGWAKCR